MSLTRTCGVLLGSGWLCALALFASPVHAQKVVQEPNGFLVPQPANPTEVTCCVTGRGYPPDAADLSGLFTFRNDPDVDWEADARTGPGVFSPLCGFSGALVLRGGDCKMDFGWYNVNSSGGAPADNEIVTIISRDDPEVFKADFCPLAGITTNPGEMNKCQVKTFNASEIRTHPRYQGGLIGFALRGAQGTLCSQTHYSQNELHPPCQHCTPAAPWIMSLMYESKAFPDSYYIAFEDRPAPGPMQNFGANQPNDGDFNDFVFFITGVTCEGGGQACDASLTNPELKGVCAVGRTGCAGLDGAVACNPIVQPSPETCDNIDNDCNGLVDDGNLCGQGLVCDKGVCVRSCTGGEFRCEGGLECNTSGYCVDPACKDVVCEPGQVCRAGVCSGGCGPEVVCPRGQECQLGRCVDLCAGVTCEDDTQVCERGACVANCSCRPCIEGKVCSANGSCVDAGCENKNCGAGSHCIAGECVDSCAGVVCPGGAKCTAGRCEEPMASAPSGTGGGSNASGGGISINPGGPSAGGAQSQPGNPSAPSNPGTSTRGTPDEGCGCRSAPAHTSTGWLTLGLGLALTALIRRSRSGHTSRRERR